MGPSPLDASSTSKTEHSTSTREPDVDTPTVEERRLGGRRRPLQRHDDQRLPPSPARYPDHRARSLATDPAVDTAYIATGDNSMAMIDTRTCNAACPTGARDTAPGHGGHRPVRTGVDRAYAHHLRRELRPAAAGSVWVLDERSYNATGSSWLQQTSGTPHVPGGNAQDIAVNRRPTPSTWPRSQPTGGPNLQSRCSTAQRATRPTSRAAPRYPQPWRSQLTTGANRAKSSP